MNINQNNSQKPSKDTFDREGIEIIDDKLGKQSLNELQINYTEEDIEVATKVIRQLFNWEKLKNEKKN